MKPTTDHPITIRQNPRRVRVTLGGHVVADSTRALVLQESTYPPVHYIPREDADMAVLSPTPRSTQCPYKGQASYFTIAAGGRTADNAVWSYEDPFPAVAEIAGHLAFYPDRVDAIEEV